MNSLATLLSYEFMRNALVAGILVSITCGIIGTLVILNRIVFLAGGIAHAAYGGVGLAFFLGIDPMLGAIAFSLVSSTAMGYVQRKTRQRADTLIGVMWAIGMALGVIFTNLRPGYKADLMSYLFGSILAVSTVDTWIMFGVLLLVIVVVISLYKQLLAISFDDTFATVRNLPVDLLYMVMVTLIGIVVVVSMRVVGLIMIIALLTIPPAIASMFSRQMWKIMVVASLLSTLFMIVGLLLSFTLDLSSGASIILVSGVGYILAFIIKGLASKYRLKTKKVTG